MHAPADGTLQAVCACRSVKSVTPESLRARRDVLSRPISHRPRLAKSSDLAARSHHVSVQQWSWTRLDPLESRDQVTKHARAPADTAASDAKHECTRELSTLAAQDDEPRRAATSHDDGHHPDARWSKDRMVVGCRLEADAQHHDVVDGASSESKPRLLRTAGHRYRAGRPSRGSRSSQERRGTASPWPRRAARRAAAQAPRRRSCASAATVVTNGHTRGPPA